MSKDDELNEEEIEELQRKHNRRMSHRRKNAVKSRTPQKYSLRKVEEEQ
jgi:hypothetical protein